MSTTGGIGETGHMVYFNSDFSYVVVLFKGFNITSFFNYILACLFILFLCWSERLLSYCLGNNLKYDKNHSRWKIILIKTLGFSVVTIFRLFYMLITMTMNSQLFIVVVLGLTTGQFIVEYISSRSIYSTIIHKEIHETLSLKDTLGGNESPSTYNKIIYTDEELSNDFVISNINEDYEDDDTNDNSNNNNNNNNSNDDNNNNNNNDNNNNSDEEDDDDDENNSEQKIMISNQ
ncbi:hypothetical protein Glove_423g57 [Diversispora epigaea]|uniref:Copper transport protein n=1 Tax=Diversispora epigaea TaxID=1348612 RepID=A0A397GVE3_9GLOM|nr:hypothetical protein Glove_423g57 [Diversispora epigaea]